MISDHLLFPPLYALFSGPEWQPGWFAVVYIGNTNQKSKETYTENCSSRFGAVHILYNVLTF